MQNYVLNGAQRERDQRKQAIMGQMSGQGAPTQMYGLGALFPQIAHMINYRAPTPPTQPAQMYGLGALFPEIAQMPNYRAPTPPAPPEPKYGLGALFPQIAQMPQYRAPTPPAQGGGQPAQSQGLMGFLNRNGGQ